MARHTMQAYALAVARPRKPDERYNLGNLRDSGHDLLDLLEQQLAGIQAPIKGSDRFARFDVVERRGRTLRVAVSVGQYGTRGELFDVVANTKVADVLPDHASLVRVHNLIVLPRHGDTGLLIAEQYGGRGGYTALKGQIKIALSRAMGDTAQLHADVLANDALWQKMLESGELRSIVAVRYETEADKADPKKRRRIGVRKYERAGWRESALSRTYLDRALAGEAPGSLVGLSDPLEDAEVHATLRMGSQEKTFVIGKPETPSVSMIWAPDEDERPDPEDYYSAASDLAPTLLRQLGIDLPPDWRGEQPAA